eukprot:CAMPEP_0118799468 /NCGR_PEP_ID=MMETSP1161-20130426/1677_1 /TAXON_ID=249345 /ORGANISM="Picochlorum oklahomensis, Strain CCMP2329" /LENGTH=73 /DNA_ID=CAMNT_0006727175 /DNA_START=447 /DNA_END=664 /DNA_ORIENTATION=+
MAEHNPKDTTSNEEITPEYNDNFKHKSHAVSDGEPGPSARAARTTGEGRMPSAFHVDDDNSEEEVDQICVEMA